MLANSARSEGRGRALIGLLLGAFSNLGTRVKVVQMRDAVRARLGNWEEKLVSCFLTVGDDHADARAARGILQALELATLNPSALCYWVVLGPWIQEPDQPHRH
jgi:hypothetical protein